MRTLKTNKDNKVVFENKQDVIHWLKRCKEMQPVTTAELQKVDSSLDVAEVFTDNVICDRYQGMIDWLESDEVA